jgi:hypothetical protein
MDYYEPEITIEETIEDYAINYVDSWADEYKSIAQSIVDKYLMLENKPMEELDEDDVWSLDGLIFDELKKNQEQVLVNV